MKNLRLFSLIALALVISIALTSAYTPILSADSTKNNQNQVNSFGVPALACEVGYYGYDCHNSITPNRNSNTNNNYNSNYYYNNNHNDNEYYYPGYYYNNYNRNYNSQYFYNINYQKNPPKTNYVLYTQDDKLSYLRTYETRQYRIYNSDYQVRYVRADPERCFTKDYVYPCDFYYGKIQ